MLETYVYISSDVTLRTVGASTVVADEALLSTLLALTEDDFEDPTDEALEGTSAPVVADAAASVFTGFSAADAVVEFSEMVATRPLSAYMLDPPILLAWNARTASKFRTFWTTSTFSK